MPDGDGLGFVILVRDKLELMLQSQASLAKDVPAIATGKDRSVLYLEVESLDPIRTALAGWPRIIDERTTFYGARELIVEAPSGHVVFFAVHG